MTRQWLLSAAVAVCALATTAGCGSSPAPGAPSRAQAPDPGAASTSPTLSATERLDARESLIRLSDFPDGWTTQGKITEGDGASGLTKSEATQLTECLEVPPSEIDTAIPHWTSARFVESSDAVTVDDDVSVYPDAAKADTDYSTFSDSKTPGCLVELLGPTIAQQIGAQLQPGQRVGTVTAGTRDIGSFGTRSGDIELAVPIVEGTKEVPVYVDVIVVVEGRAESTLTASSPGIPFSETLGARLAQVAATRMRPFR